MRSSATIWLATIAPNIPNYALATVGRLSVCLVTISRLFIIQEKEREQTYDCHKLTSITRIA